MEKTNETTQEKLNNLFIAARNARDAKDAETAIRHYEEISALEPNSWEALFYLAILKTNNIKNGEIGNAAIRVINCLPKVFELIKTTIDEEEKQKEAVKEVKGQCTETAVWLITASGNFYNATTETGISLSVFDVAASLDTKRKARYESANRMGNIGNMLGLCGTCIETTFGLEDSVYQDFAVDCWEAMLALHFEHIKLYKVEVFDEESVEKFASKVKKYKPSYEVPNIVATEKRDYTIKAIIIALSILAIGLLILFPMFNLFF